MESFTKRMLRFASALVVCGMASLYFINVTCDAFDDLAPCFDYGLEYEVENLTTESERKIVVALAFKANLSSTEIRCYINVNNTNELVQSYIKDVEENLNETTIDMKVKYSVMCSDNMTILFTGNCCGTVARISWDFVFRQCTMTLSDLYGAFLQGFNEITILDLVFTELIVDGNCFRFSSASRITIAGLLTYRALFDICETRFYASTLVIHGYLTLMTINASQLAERFPNVENLHLRNVRLVGDLQFPWKSLSLPNDTTSIEYNSLFLEILNSTCEEISFTSPIAVVLIDKSTFQFHEGRNISAFFEKTKAIKLTLSNIHLFPFTDLTISGLRTLEELYLNGNGIIIINGSTFEHQVNLKWLDISYNKIQHIPKNMFRYMLRLIYLNLEHNLIRTLEYDVFDSILSTIRYIYLNSNPLRTIPQTQLYSPTLQILDVHDCSLNDESMEILVKGIDKDKLNIRKDVYGSGQDYCPRTVFDISQNNISASKPFASTRYDQQKFYTLLSRLLVKINPSPIICNCIPEVNSNPIITSYYFYLNNKCSSTYQNLTYPQLDWLCEYPSEFRGRPVHTITEMEEYCKIVHEDCPDRCTCFKRTYSPTIIIDCGNVNVSYLPLSFNTNFSIEMWFRNSSLKGQLDSTDYLYKVKVIDISYNAVNKITDAFFDNLIFVETTKLNNNELQTLPTNIASINATSISVSGNNFVCDCTNKWFKYWLLEDEHVVADWLEVKCTTVNGENKQIIAVPDSLFICRSEVRFSVNEHVVFPSVIIGSTLFVIVILVALTFAFRENVKVFMFLYFGIHPFDNRLDGKNRYDAALIYSVENKHAASNILKVLGEKYKVADVHMDAVVGMTIFDSMDYLILSSRRALFFISEHELLNPFTMHAWRTAYKHARDTHFDFIILIAKDQNLERSGHIPASLLRFINLRGVIFVGTKLFKGRLEYKMPRHRLKNDDETHIELEHVQEDKNVLIYHERDDPYEQLADQEIIPNLNEKGILVKWLICEFQFGTDIRYEIFEIFSRTDRLIFILSRRTLLDSESMFILSSAITQSRLQKGIFLLLYVVEEIDENSRLVNGDLLEFLRQNIYLTHEERHPVEKLYEAIRFEQEIDVNRDDSENSVGDGEHEDMIGNAD